MAGKGMDAGKARTDWAKVHANRSRIDRRPWRILEWGASCPDCGCEPEVRTDATEPGAVYDADDIRCSNRCGLTGSAIVFDVDDASINWFDDEGNEI